MRQTSKDADEGHVLTSLELAARTDLRHSHPEICAEAKLLTWPCGNVSREFLLLDEKNEKREYPYVCTNKGAMSPDVADEAQIDYGLSPLWTLFAQRLHSHMKDNCDYFVESYTPAQFDPPLFNWFGDGNSPLTEKPLKALQALPPSEQERWFTSVRYDATGSPTKLLTWPSSHEAVPHAPLSIEHVQHVGPILAVEKTLKTDMSQVGAIVEFGPGTGAFAQQFRDLGFKGQHITFENPVALLAQKFWYRNRGLNSCKFPDCNDAAGTIWQTSAVDELRDALIKLPAATKQKPGVFLATYSLTEAPVALRERIFDVLKASPAVSHLVIAYSDDMGSLENSHRRFTSNRDFLTQAFEKHKWGACGFKQTKMGRDDPLVIVSTDGSPVECVEAAGCSLDSEPLPSCGQAVF